jgi:hypothetical protein
LVADDVAEALDGLGVDGDFGRGKVGVNGELGELLVVAEPESPVKVFDGLVSTLDHLVDWGKAHLGFVQELEVQRDRDTVSFFVHDEGDLARGRVEREGDGFKVGGVRARGSGRAE